MKTLIKNVRLVNENAVKHIDILIENGIFTKISEQSIDTNSNIEINGENLLAFPGLIDDQVHFREPGLTHKGELFTESRAAVAGGLTSYMEMPNTKPGATTISLLEDKYNRAAQVSLANYSFYMGTTNDNLEELLKIEKTKVCGVKIFLGSSTGDMLVDNEGMLSNVFANIDKLIAVHCEYDPWINENLLMAKLKYGDDIPVSEHPHIRSREACFKSSNFAIDLAKKHGARLHILHISTAEELALFDNKLPLKEKKITAEACIHHLWFSDEDYAEKGNFIKWNPAVKKATDREALWQAIHDGRIDVIATDHAPHTLEEKNQKYMQAPSGGPLVQHSLQALLEKVAESKLALQDISHFTAHQVADLFGIVNRGYVREGYAADLVLVDPNKPETVNKNNLFYKCGWSPFEGTTFSNSIHSTFVNGHLAYTNGAFNDSKLGERMLFTR